MSEFWVNFWGNLSATLISVALGIPIAFWIDRKVRERGEKEKSKERLQRTTKMLELIRAELHNTHHALTTIHTDVANYYSVLSHEVCDAFSDGGELQWIDDSLLLARISGAYGLVRHVSNLYDKYIQAFYFPGMIGNPNVKDSLFNVMLKLKDETLFKVEESLKLIDEKLDSTKKK